MEWFVIVLLLVIILLLVVFIPHVKDRYESKIEVLTSQIKRLEAILSTHDQNVEEFNKMTIEKRIELAKTELEVKASSSKWLADELEKYKARELVKYKEMLEKNALNSAAIALQQWKAEKESEIRQDATKRSHAVSLGKALEHFAPFHNNFPFNPADARFIGSPIDLIVFDGVTDNADNVTIYFIEVKTGKGRLNERQKIIKSAVERREIIWLEINPLEM